jgi:hypothetical protein
MYMTKRMLEIEEATGRDILDLIKEAMDGSSSHMAATHKFNELVGFRAIYNTSEGGLSAFARNLGYRIKRYIVKTNVRLVDAPARTPHMTARMKEIEAALRELGCFPADVSLRQHLVAIAPRFVSQLDMVDELNATMEYKAMSGTQALRSWLDCLALKWTRHDETKLVLEKLEY